jgi:hypothetical protein
VHGDHKLLSTKTGLLFIDLETCCRGPVESDLANVPKMSAIAIRTLMKNCSVAAGSLFLPWSQHGAGMAVKIAVGALTGIASAASPEAASQPRPPRRS